MRLSHNSLSGTAPAEWSELDGLVGMDLQSNDLSGPLRPEVGGESLNRIFTGVLAFVFSYKIDLLGAVVGPAQPSGVLRFEQRHDVDPPYRLERAFAPHGAVPRG